MQPTLPVDYRPMTLRDLFAVLRRRKWSLVLPAVLVFLIAAGVALFLPSIYKSTSTIIIEEQEVPDHFVQATVTGYAEQRIQTINQRIMSFSKLRDIIQKFGLYSDLRDKLPMEQIYEEMREDIELKLISAETSDKRRGRTESTTIAFTLSYEGKNPDTVQRVANELASLFLSENMKVRERKTLETSQFIEEEMNKVKTSLADLDQQIGDFKRGHMNELPELLQVNQQSLNNLETNVARVQEQLRSLKEKKEYLEIQVANTPRDLEVTDKKRLQELKLLLGSLQTRYTEAYPDVLETRAEIERIEARLKSDAGTGIGPAGQTDNPAYVTLASQFAGTQADIESVTRQIQELEQKASVYRSRIQATPKVEEAYNALVIEQASLQTKYGDLMKKLMEARLAHGMEREQMGERFTLLEPPLMPEEPYKPNRLLIALVGLVLGIGAGGAMVFLRENMDDSVKDAFSLSMATSIPVLATIPEIRTSRDVALRRVRRAALAAAVIVILAGGVFAFHHFVMDLDLFWLKVASKLNTLLV